MIKLNVLVITCWKINLFPPPPSFFRNATALLEWAHWAISSYHMSDIRLLVK